MRRKISVKNISQMQKYFHTNTLKIPVTLEIIDINEFGQNNFFKKT